MNERPAVPLHFGDENRELFGWIHSPTNRKTVRSAGIVLCNPIGDDYVRAHRAFRHLAERLAREGYPVLRFDFHGTGDSAGDEDAPDRVPTWLEDIGRAIDTLAARTGVGRVALIGLRLGATLAAFAAAGREDVSELVLWDPYLSGHAFSTDAIRQRKLQAMLDPAGFGMKSPPGTLSGEEGLGFLITHATIAELSKVELARQEKRPAPRILLIEPKPSPATASLVERLRELGATVESRQLDHKFLSQTPHQSSLPEQEIEAITSWLGAEPAPATVREGSKPTVELRVAEEPVFFGEDQSRFGILHAPKTAAASKLPAIVIVNAGTVHRIGPHRLYVRMARKWTELGFHVLRVDISGIGDTPAEAGTIENVCYPPRHVDDVKAALSFLEGRLSVDRFVLVGLCSGADTAFRVSADDPRVVGAVMMNPRTFCINDLEAVERIDETRQFQGSLNKKESWIKLLKGQVNFAWHFRNLVPNVRALVEKKTRALVAKLKPGGSFGSSDHVPSRLRHLAESGVSTLLLTSEHDPGTEYVDVHFPAEMRSLEEVRGFKRQTFKGMDHTFTSLAAQKCVLETVTEHLTRNHRS